MKAVTIHKNIIKFNKMGLPPWQKHSTSNFQVWRDTWLEPNIFKEKPWHAKY